MALIRGDAFISMWILIGAALIRRLRLLETRRLIEEIWYRVRIRSKKWWWLFFAWAVNALIANAWNLFRTVQKQKIGMLEFQRVVVMTLLASFWKNKPAKSMAFPRNIASNVKLDTKNHIVVKGTQKYCRCKHCGGKRIYLCQRCNVALHPVCFKDYYS